MKISEILRLLKDDGWNLDRTRGSHRQFIHKSKPGTVTVSGKPSDEVAPGCIATGGTEAETKANMADAIAFHLEGITQYGLSIPDNQTTADYVEIAA